MAEKKPIASQDRPRLILASGSPRRRELLERAGYEFRVLQTDVDESVSGTPRQMVDELSERKARAAAESLSEGIVLAADTLVAMNGEALGKPTDEADARRMLNLLNGSAHEVLTGVCALDAATTRMTKLVACTKVRFKRLSERDIEDYIASGEPMDKAGAYGIQGLAGAFVDSIEGSYTNVMGLPVEAIGGMLDRLTKEGEH